MNTESTQPILPKIHDQKTLINEAVNLSAEDAYDPDGDTLTFNWQLLQKPKGSIAKISNPDRVNATINTDQQGIYQIRLNISDGNTSKSQDIQVFSVENFEKNISKNPGLFSQKGISCILDRIFLDGFDVNNGNPPLLNSQPVAVVGDDRLGVLGQQMVLDGSASFDIDLDDITYQWSLLSSPNNSVAAIINANVQIASLTPDLIGDYVVQLIVDDGNCGSTPDSALVTISVNQAPNIISVANTQAVEAHGYSYQINATDPENHNLDYSLTIAPSGMIIDTNGLITWTALPPNSYAVSVMVTDEYGANTSQSFDIAVSANQAPKIQTWPISSGEKDFSYAYQVIATDAENDSIAYSLMNPPAGMTIDTNGLISWIPDTIGIYAIQVQADDGFGGLSSQSFDLDIIELPPNPDDIAPPLSKTEYTPFPESIGFLYQNNPPVQLGMPPNTIQDYRVAVITGKVLDDDNNPVRGIKVTINNHPEFGHTFTRDNGIFFIPSIKVCPKV